MAGEKPAGERKLSKTTAMPGARFAINSQLSNVPRAATRGMTGLAADGFLGQTQRSAMQLLREGACGLVCGDTTAPTAEAEPTAKGGVWIFCFLEAT
jgi:hypothetical protein